MTPARKSKTPIPHARRHLFEALAKAMRPRPLTTVSAWADRFRILTSKGSGEPGQWRTERTPYLREIMDSLSATSPRIAVTPPASTTTSTKPPTPYWRTSPRR